MGNVHASGPPPPIIPSVDPSLIDKNENKGKPGTMEDLHKKCKDVFPTPFEGARIVLNKGLSNHFQVNHTISMSQTLSGYKFGATYVGTNIVGPGEAFPVLLGDIDPKGNVHANILCQFHPRLRTKAVVQIQDSKCQALQITNDFKSKNSTTSLTLGNINPINSSGIGILQYLQTVSPTLDLGAELACQFGPSVPGGMFTALSLAGRYTSPKNFIASGNITAQSIHLCYYHKPNEHLQVGVELETNFRLSESIASIGYQVDLPKSDSVFRGSVDSNWGVTGVLEKKLQPLPFTLTLSGHLLHSTRTPIYRFGIGLTLG